MRNQVLWTVVVCVGVLFFVSSASAAPGDSAPPPTTAPTPTPVPETSPPAAAQPQPIMPVSTEKRDKMAQAKKFIWWGAAFSITGAVFVAAGVPLLLVEVSGSDDEISIAGFSLIGIGMIMILASTPVWIVGLVKKSKISKVDGDGQHRIVPRDRHLVDVVQRRYFRRLLTQSGPPAVPVLAYGFRF